MAVNEVLNLETQLSSNTEAMVQHDFSSDVTKLTIDSQLNKDTNLEVSEDTKGTTNVKLSVKF